MRDTDNRERSARRENYSRGVLQVVMLSTVMSRCPRHTKQHTLPHAHMIKYNISLSHPLPREEYTLPPPKRRRAETCSRLSPPLHTSPNPHKMSPYALSQNAASAPPSLSSPPRLPLSVHKFADPSLHCSFQLLSCMSFHRARSRSGPAPI